jgi:hypothetical protein
MPLSFLKSDKMIQPLAHQSGADDAGSDETRHGPQFWRCESLKVLGDMR